MAPLPVDAGVGPGAGAKAGVSGGGTAKSGWAKGGMAAKGGMEKGGMETDGAAAPSWPWFAGVTGGYLIDEYETEWFSAHAGKEMSYTLGGWSPSAYLEVAYFEAEDLVYSPNLREATAPPGFRRLSFEAEIIPVTLNYKLERSIGERLNLYWGAGAGVAFVDMELSFGPSDDDEVFFAQVFGGIIHEVSQRSEVFAGARWIYLDDANFMGMDVELHDDFLVEGGFRFNF